MTQPFGHEKMIVYQKGMRFIAWLDPMLAKFSCSADLRLKLDKSTTAIALNIAEGNGRFTGADQRPWHPVRAAYPARLASGSESLAIRGASVILIS